MSAGPRQSDMSYTWILTNNICPILTYSPQTDGQQWAACLGLKRLYNALSPSLSDISKHLYLAYLTLTTDYIQFQTLCIFHPQINIRCAKNYICTVRLTNNFNHLSPRVHVLYFIHAISFKFVTAVDGIFTDHLYSVPSGFFGICPMGVSPGELSEEFVT